MFDALMIMFGILYFWQIMCIQILYTIQIELHLVWSFNQDATHVAFSHATP